MNLVLIFRTFRRLLANNRTVTQKKKQDSKSFNICTFMHECIKIMSIWLCYAFFSLLLAQPNYKKIFALRDLLILHFSVAKPQNKTTQSSNKRLLFLWANFNFKKYIAGQHESAPLLLQSLWVSDGSHTQCTESTSKDLKGRCSCLSQQSHTQTWGNINWPFK